MTTITNYNMAMPPSPRASMDRKIDAAVEAGSLSEVDSTALESALDSIDTALSSSASETTSRLDPSEMKDRIDSLIDEQVSAGTLTEEQASALQSFFAQGPGGSVQSADASSDDSMSIEGMGGVGGPGRMGGPPPGPPPSEATDEDSDSSTVSATDSSVTDQLDSMIAFLENLRASMSQSLYGSAASSADSSNSGLLVDSLA
ncbi:hypothetical protein [Sphingobium sp. YR768]|uniref:hypothetical protein n=1 Tax=Sphingobium sp. YR768 TaxID=1884365 RepID=UPI0008D4E059|nr:hypothetical protein [Sphingobium sp. YR768]SER05902.1 hypothetical protein SAMN05518866_104272 [Sphingobium sp. YR768]